MRRHPHVRCSAPIRPVTTARRHLAVQAPVRKPSVLIIGGGSSGLTLGLSLQRRGWKTDLIEQMSSDREPLPPVVSEGTYLSSNVMRAFHQLGVGPNIEKSGVILKESRTLGERGGIIGRINLSTLAKSYGGHPAVAISYRSLLRELSAAYLSAGGKLSYNTSFTKLKQSDNTVSCTFSGSKPTAKYDLVIGADGHDSKVRELVFDKKDFRYVKRFERWGYYHVSTVRPMDIVHDQISEYWGNASRLTIIPTSADTLSVRVTYNSVYPPYALKGGLRGIEDMTNITERWSSIGGLAHLMRLISTEKHSYLTFPFEHKLQSWVNGRVVLIGDAAHVVMPNYPVLSCLSIEDGYVLAKHLDEKSSMVEQALADYQTSRFSRVFDMQRISWDMNRVGQRKNWFARLWRFGTMFVTHNNSAVTRRERKLIGSKNILS